jgi:hypothetical protein
MRLRVRIEGRTPLICNRFTDEAALAATSGSRGSSAAQDRGTSQEIAESKLYIGLDGKPMIPQPNLLRCLIEGGRFHKVGKAQLTTKTGSQLFSCFDIEGAEIPILHKLPWRVDTRAVRIPSTGGRILTHRPMFDDWALEFGCELDTDICGVKLMRLVVDDAGKRVGLGDFRPQTKGPFGRFDVTRWEVIEIPMMEAAYAALERDEAAA